jgi:pyruvate dehydrogenase (quinone)/pyruvate oxidase
MLMADFVTCVKYNLPVKIFVINNLSLGQIKWEQMVFLGHPEYVCDLAPIDFAMVARACGGAGRTVREPGDCGRIIEDALNTPGPVVVDCYVDTHEPPMPPKIKPGQALKFAAALASGTPAGGKIALTVASDKVRELI